MKKQLLVLAIVLITAAAVTRVLRHLGYIDLPPNVAPIAALAMFGGCYLPRRLAFLLPLGAMLLSDAAIGFYNPAIMASVYGSFMISSLLGFWLRKRRKLFTIIGATLVGSITFFLITNAAVWLFGNLYSKTLAGLGASYFAGLPFFRNTILGDLAFTGFLFGSYELAVLFLKRRAPLSAEERK